MTTTPQSVVAVADRYDRLSSAFLDKLRKVKNWDAPTPCTEWTVRDLCDHVVEMNDVHLTMVGFELAIRPEDPIGAFEASRAQILAALRDPEDSQAEFRGRFGTFTFEGVINLAVCNELALHGWDLARATGQDETIPADEIPKLWASLELAGEEAIRAEGVTGPALEVPDDADDQTKLLAYVGRRA